jgi:hypothetical protein
MPLLGHEGLIGGLHLCIPSNNERDASLVNQQKKVSIISFIGIINSKISGFCALMIWIIVGTN